MGTEIRNPKSEIQKQPEGQNPMGGALTLCVYLAKREHLRALARLNNGLAFRLRILDFGFRI